LVGGIAFDLERPPLLRGQLQRGEDGVPVGFREDDDLPPPIHEAGKPVRGILTAVIHPSAVDEGHEGGDRVRQR
jgi:hypothetical protein